MAIKTLYKNSLILITTTIITQIITIVSSPIITRLFSPNDFGIYSSIITISTLIAVGASFDFNKAIPISESYEESLDLILTSFFFLFFISLLVLLFSYLFNIQYVDRNTDAMYIYIFFLTIILGSNNILIETSFRDKNFNVISLSKISFSGISLFTKILTGLLNFSYFGLIIGQLLGGISSSVAYLLPNRLIPLKEYHFNLSRIYKTIIKFKNFPLFSAPSNYLYLASNSVPVLFYSRIYNSTIAGFYSLALTVITLPLGLISNSISQVLYSEIASGKKENESNNKRILVNVLFKLIFLGLPILFTLFIFGEELFGLVFGNNWVVSGKISSYLSFMSYFHFVAMPFGRILEIYEKQKVGFWFNFIRLISIISLFLGSGFFQIDYLTTTLLYSVISSFFYIVLIGIVFIKTNIMSFKK